MDIFLYKLKKSYAKYIFSFLVSYIICSIMLGPQYILDYTLIPINSMFPQYFFSIEMFYFYMKMFSLFLIQSSIISIINFIVDVIYLDEDFEKSNIVIGDSKIEKEIYLKYLILRNIPIFSVLNFIFALFNKTGLSLLEKRMRISYYNADTSEFMGKVFLKMIRLAIIILIIQFVGSTTMMIIDPGRQLIKEIESLEVVKKLDTNLMIDNKNGNLVYNTKVYLQDGYIHYNKLTHAKEYSTETFKNLSTNIQKSIKNKVGEISIFNITFYNEYAKTWDKIMYNKDFSISYELSNISSDIIDVDIYIQNNTLVYNLLTNINKDKIGWDIAEFMLSEFEEDISNPKVQETIKQIVNSEEKINKYVVNILSQEYYTNSENIYYTYIKHVGEQNWYYYDNRFYTIEKKQKAFESKLKEYINYNFTIDFDNAYENGELLITINSPEINEDKKNKIYDDVYNAFHNSDEGKDIIKQIGHIGKSSNVTFKINLKEDISQ